MGEGPISRTDTASKYGREEDIGEIWGDNLETRNGCLRIVYNNCDGLQIKDFLRTMSAQRSEIKRKNDYMCNRSHKGRKMHRHNERMGGQYIVPCRNANSVGNPGRIESCYKRNKATGSIWWIRWIQLSCCIGISGETRRYSDIF